MKKLLNLRTLLGVALIVFALLPKNKTPEPVLLNIEKPTQEVIDVVLPMSKIVTDPTDRAKLAIFNQEFANRVNGYNADTQQINDVYVLAGGNFFKDSLVNKYDELDKHIVSLIQHCASGDNHRLTEEEKQRLSTYFMGFAWSLIQRN